MEYLIGIDIGTSATKTVLFDANCHVVSSASQEYPLYQPQNGWAEQEPLDWYNAVLVTIRKVIHDSGVKAADIKGIGRPELPPLSSHPAAEGLHPLPHDRRICD